MSAPIKEATSESYGRTTDEESSPSKSLHEIFAIPSGMTFESEIIKVASSRLLKRNIGQEEFHRFINLNPKFGNDVFLFQNMLLWSDPQEEENIDAESDIHGQACTFMAETIGTFRRGVKEAHGNIKFVGSTSSSPQYGVGASMSPDFIIKLINVMNAFVVGEFQYATTFADGHQRAQRYSTFPHIRAIIIINIRYPWNHQHGHYIVNDGHLVLCYYRCDGGQRDPVTNELIPDRIVSFGNTPLSAVDTADISAITHFPVDNMEGVGLKAGLYCDLTTRNNATFVHVIPAALLLVQNVNDDIAMTGHPIHAIPDHFNFTISMYDLKLSLQEGAELLNNRIQFGQETVPQIAGYRL